MFFPSENELFFGSGLDEKQIQLTNLDFYKILPKITKKPFKVMRYFEIPTKELVDYNIILYYYPGFVGHWTLLCMDKDLEKIYFFDPYGRDVDTQWPFLKGYLENGTEYYILKNIIVHSGYRYYYNPYNVQGSLKEYCNSRECEKIADNECGELVCFRILYKDLSDLEFYHKCLKTGPKNIFNIIKSL
jgi:hypothetical protein